MLSLSKRKLIKKNIKLKILKSKITEKEKLAVNFGVFIIIVLMFLSFNAVTSYNAKFYTKEDITNFNIDTKTIVKIKKVAEEKNIEFEKLLVRYSEDNNYFAKGSYVKEFEKPKSKLIENLKFTLFALNKQDKDVYNMVKSINSEIMCLPIKKENYKDVISINSFDASKKKYGTIFIEKDNYVCNIDVVSITDGVVESVVYDGENGLSITIESNSGNKYVYANLSEVKVKEGSKVNSGKVLGVMGNSKQVKDEISLDRCKLKIYVLCNFDGEETFFNIYPLLTTKN